MTTEATAPQAPPRLDHSKITASEMFDDLLGLEEIAVSRAFGQSVNDLSNNATQFLRALIFADLRRGGQKDREAFTAAQGMRLGEVRSYFRDDEEAAADDDTVGKEKP